MHANTRVILAKYVMPHLTPAMRVLEVGPDFDERIVPSWDTAGIDNDPRLTYRCGKYTLPILSNTYDAVVAVNVMEHVGVGDRAEEGMQARRPRRPHRPRQLAVPQGPGRLLAGVPRRHAVPTGVGRAGHRGVPSKRSGSR